MMEDSVFVTAASWIQAVLLGPLATSLAIIAVAVVGLQMLTGRTNVRRGATVLAGCFILFGAATIARGIMGAAANTSGAPSLAARQHGAPMTEPALSPVPAQTEDPYAGAALAR